MKIVAMIPLWLDYKSTVDSLECRPILNIGGKTLVERSIETLNKIDQIEDVFIFSSNSEVKSYINNNIDFSFAKRDESLDNVAISVEDIIEEFLLVSDADIVVFVNPKNPFMKAETISECIDKVRLSEFDSSFVASLIRKYAWFKSDPLNYSREIDTPLLFDIDPVTVELSSVYVFTRKLFSQSRNRIGKNPFIKYVGHFEGFEVDREEDRKIAELILNSGLDKEEYLK